VRKGRGRGKEEGDEREGEGGGKEREGRERKALWPYNRQGINLGHTGTVEESDPFKTSYNLYTRFQTVIIVLVTSTKNDMTVLLLLYRIYDQTY
jgi:hypothetical protein